MATVIETKDLEVLFNLVQKAHNALLNFGAERVITELKIDKSHSKWIDLFFTYKGQMYPFRVTYRVIDIVDDVFDDVFETICNKFGINI